MSTFTDLPISTPVGAYSLNVSVFPQIGYIVLNRGFAKSRYPHQLWMCDVGVVPHLGQYALPGRIQRVIPHIIPHFSPASVTCSRQHPVQRNGHDNGVLPEFKGFSAVNLCNFGNSAARPLADVQLKKDVGQAFVDWNGITGGNLKSK